jgi:HPt (histidine-containing phosphotransfer) domain-containing protein
MATPNPSDLDQAALDRLRKLGGEKLLREMIDLFLQHSPGRVEAALAAESADDQPGISRAVHSLKSSAANVGAVALRDLSANIEAVSMGQSAGNLAELMKQLNPTFANARQCLEEKRKELGS